MAFHLPPMDVTDRGTSFQEKPAEEKYRKERKAVGTQPGMTVCSHWDPGFGPGCKQRNAVCGKELGAGDPGECRGAETPSPRERPVQTEGCALGSDHGASWEAVQCSVPRRLRGTSPMATPVTATLTCSGDVPALPVPVITAPYPCIHQCQGCHA